MKDFKKFLEEVTIKGNPGIPGEGERKPGDVNYLSDIERRAKTRLGVTGREFPRQMPEIGDRIMSLLRQSQSLTRGKEKELEKLAKKIILSNYGDILNDVVLDIKLSNPQEITQNLSDDDCDDCEIPKFRNVTDPDLIKRIHKAKLSNNIIQGEAKNTKHIIHSDEVKEGLQEIFGNRWEEIFNVWDNISKLADKMDWIIPIQVKSDMMEQQPEGMAGSVSLNWTKNDSNEYKEKEEEDQKEQEPEEEFYTPVIRARGIDFPMLIHESVKGIYELIASVSQPSEGASESEIEKAKTVKLNVSSFEDESEDFRTGPEIAADLRDFINANPDASYHRNMREFIFGKMMDEKYMTPDEFLKLFRGILNKTEEARIKVDSMISEVISELKRYELGDLGSEYEVEVDFKEEDTKELDYSKLSQKQLQELVDGALDSGDFEKVKQISKYLKEGREIYLREIKMINENHSYHKK